MILELDGTATTKKIIFPYYDPYLAVVTGGLNGNLGPIISQKLCDMGYHIFHVDLPTYDLRQPDTIMRAYNDCPSIPSILINNAAIDIPPTTEGSGFFDQLADILMVNLLSAIQLSAAFGLRMAMFGHGLIINIGSIMGTVAADWHLYPKNFDKPVAYNISKAGLVALSRSLTAQYGRYGLRSVCLGFGPVDTGKFKDPFRTKMLDRLPLQRLVSPESVKAGIEFVIRCPEVAGNFILIDAGYTCW